MAFFKNQSRLEKDYKNKESKEKLADCSRKNENKCCEIKSGHWNSQELYKLSTFLACHQHKFITTQSIKQFKAFRHLSRFVNSRNTIQCKKYVENLLNVFQNIQKINIYFKTILPFYDPIVSFLTVLALEVYIDKTSNIKQQVDGKLKQILTKCQKIKAQERKFKEDAARSQIKVEVKEQAQNFCYQNQGLNINNQERSQQQQEQKMKVEAKESRGSYLNYNWTYYPFYMPLYY